MRLVWVLFGSSLLVTVGCASSTRSGGVLAEDGASGRVACPARDLDPAVRFAAPRIDMVVESISVDAHGDRRYELLTVRGEPALVEVRSDDWPADDRDAASVRIEARVGRFGDTGRERALVRAIVDRLGALTEEPRTGGIRP